MWPRLRQGIKILASGIGFSALGLGGVLFSLLIFPLLKLLPGGKPALQRRIRRVIHLFFHIIVQFLQAAGIFRLQTENLPKTSSIKGTLILATHPGYLDVVVILSVLEQVVCIVKEGVWNNPAFGRVVRAAGYIPAGEDPEEVIHLGSAALAQGENLLIFPEGTRTHPGSPYKFQRGAAHLALRSGAPILPLAVSCEPPLLAKGERWYQLPERVCDYRVCALPPLPPMPPAGMNETTSSAARQVTEQLESHFNQEIYGPGSHSA